MIIYYFAGLCHRIMLQKKKKTTIDVTPVGQTTKLLFSFVALVAPQLLTTIKTQSAFTHFSILA